MKKIDPAEYQKRLDRITEIFADMVNHADTVSQTRCPYRDRHDHCTAEFRCRNQRPEDEIFICGHDGKFDYRSAWDTNPDAYRRAKTTVAKIKRESGAARRRAESDRTEGD